MKGFRFNSQVLLLFSFLSFSLVVQQRAACSFLHLSFVSTCSSWCSKALSLLVGSLQLNKKLNVWRRTRTRRSLNTTSDRDGIISRCCFIPDILLCPSCFNLLVFLLIIRAFLFICWVNEFLEGIAEFENVNVGRNVGGQGAFPLLRRRSVSLRRYFWPDRSLKSSQPGCLSLCRK